MSAKDEKLHVNNKEENWSVQIMQGFKVELVLDFVRVVTSFEYFYFSFRHFARFIQTFTCLSFFY